MCLLLVRRSRVTRPRDPVGATACPSSLGLGCPRRPLSNFAGAVTRTRTSTPTAPIKHHCTSPRRTPLRPDRRRVARRRPAVACWAHLTHSLARQLPAQHFAAELPVTVIVCREAFVLDLDDVAPAVGLGSVGVGEAVERRQLAGGNNLATPARYLWIAGEGCHRSAGVGRRFRDAKVRHVNCGLAPGFL